MLKSKTTQPTIRTKSANWSPATGEWLIDDGKTIVDPTQDYEWVQDPPTVSAIAYQMLYTSAERVKARQLRETDPTVDDFWRLLDDQRTSVVDLSLESVQNATEYTLNAVNAAGVVVDVPVRLAEILTGAVK